MPPSAILWIVTFGKLVLVISLGVWLYRRARQHELRSAAAGNRRSRPRWRR
ncbi:MAG: hypothetical protein HKP27_04720 [Myxococcales bacterium]|nr:hypothetical protein [Myxococcales bacterium]